MKNVNRVVSIAVDEGVLKCVKRDASRFVDQLIHDDVEKPATLTLKHSIDWEIRLLEW